MSRWGALLEFWFSKVRNFLLPLKIRDRDGRSELSLFSTVATFGSPADITISELAIEAFYPANAQTATRLLEEIGAVERSS